MVYLLTNNLSKALQWDKHVSCWEKLTSEKTQKTFENMIIKESANLFFESILKKASKFHFIDGPILPR